MTYRARLSALIFSGLVVAVCVLGSLVE